MVARVSALVLALACVGGSACAGSEACTELGCTSTVRVDYDAPISEPYLLYVTVGERDDMIRCNDDGSLESQDNPDWIDCDPRGFEYEGEEANENSVLITIQLLDADETVLVGNELVNLPASEDLIQPNGPDCDPTCVERRGQVDLDPLN